MISLNSLERLVEIMNHGVYEGTMEENIWGEKIGESIKRGIDKTTYFIVGTCIIGTVVFVYTFIRSFGKGWKKASKKSPGK